MGRGSSLIMGLLGIILPGYLIYAIINFLGINSSIVGQGFFYQIVYLTTTGGTSDYSIEWINNNWISLPQGVFNTDIQFYLYIAGFALAVLGFLVMFGSAKGGSILFLLAGLVNLGLLVLVYTELTGDVYPIPVGSIFLIIAGLLGLRAKD